MAIKMRVDTNAESICDNCGCEFRNTSEMYDMQITDRRFTLCKKCVDLIFQKTLKASVNYSGKVKTSDDLQRQKREKKHGV